MKIEEVKTGDIIKLNIFGTGFVCLAECLNNDPKNKKNVFQMVK